MSKASDIQIALNTLIETTLPGYVKLPDAYDSQDNAVIQLEKGYSVGFGIGINNTDIICKGKIRVGRSYNIVLTNVYVSNLDAGYRESLEQSLMDDAYDLLKQIDCNPTLGGLSVNSQYQDDSGIEYLDLESKQFILLTLTVLVDYFE